jgi:uncharacterized protein YutE (UPF0331/DUF86 family)
MSPGELDDRVVRRHLLALRRAVLALERHTGQAVSLLRESADERWAVERGLQLCAQNALDVATHIAAARGRDVPDYASAIDAIAEVGALPPDFAASFRDVAGFRNILVHGYLEVDLDVLHRVLNSRLQEFTTFAAHIEAFLGRADA